MPYRPHIFADNPLDRGDRERRDETWLAHKAMDPDTKILVMPELDVPLTEGDDPALSWMTPRDVTWFGIEGEPVFLGLQEEVAHFAILVPASSGAAARLRNDPSIHFVDARSAAPIVSGGESGIIAQARAQLDWHNRHGFCSVCGDRTAMARGGHVRKCEGCKAEHFPRTDPVAIMLVHDGDRCLMGQSRGRLQRMQMYSAAGIMALELAKDAIRVNCVAPGSIQFPGGSWDKRVKADPDGMREFVRANLPLGRFGKGEEVGDVVAFLASERASLITGACIAADGGQGRSLV